MTRARADAGRDRPPAGWALLERAASLALSVAGWCIMGIALLIAFDVVARRMLGFSSGATSELSGYLMAIGMAWGLSATLLARGHVRIDMVLHKLPPASRAALHVAALALLALCAAFFAWGAVSLALDSWALGATDVSQLRTPLALPQGLWAAGVALFLLTAVAVLARAAGLALRGRTGELDRLVAPRTYEDEAAETLEATRAP